MVRRTGIFVVFAALLVLVLALGAPAAWAHHKDDHDKGGKPSSSGKDSSDEDTVTEDDDDDGVDNTPDPEGDADNKHPSGKDKHEEAGESGNQGKAQSDPDDDGRGPDRSNGGVDQPGGSGGDDKLDQDGNNGCGNDDDFEDDNEGLCLGPVKRKNVDRVKVETQPSKKVPPVVEGDLITTPEAPEVEGDVTTNPEGPEVEGQPALPDVLGIRISAAPEVGAAAVAPAAAAPAVGAAAEAQGGVLPFTGSADLVPFAAVALMLIATGILALRTRRVTG